MESKCSKSAKTQEGIQLDVQLIKHTDDLRPSDTATDRYVAQPIIPPDWPKCATSR